MRFASRLCVARTTATRWRPGARRRRRSRSPQRGIEPSAATHIYDVSASGLGASSRVRTASSSRPRTTWWIGTSGRRASGRAVSAPLEIDHAEQEELLGRRGDRHHERAKAAEAVPEEEEHVRSLPGGPRPTHPQLRLTRVSPSPDVGRIRLDAPADALEHPTGVYIANVCSSALLLARSARRSLHFTRQRLWRNLANAHGSGPCGGNSLEVRVLSAALQALECTTKPSWQEQ